MSFSNLRSEIAFWGFITTLIWSSNAIGGEWHAVLPNRPRKLAVVAGTAQTHERSELLRQQVDTAIAVSQRRYLNADLHSPWQIFHGILALRGDLVLKKGRHEITSIEWLASAPQYRRVPLVEVTKYGGRFHPYTQPYAFEGHANQFLAILTWCNLPTDFEFSAGDQTVTLSDMVRNAQMTVSENEEITWTLWALSSYLEPDAHWTNKDGEAWSIERLVRIQTNQSTWMAPCGGTHGLFALTCARNRYQETKGQLQGAWLDADRNIRRHMETARSFQNRDGSFSSNFFDGPGYAFDVKNRLATSGHTLEWIVLALPDNRLDEEWVQRGVAAIARDLTENATRPLECGPLYHALHALVLYRNRLRQRDFKVAGHTIAHTKTKSKKIGSPVVNQAVRPKLQVVR